MWKQDALASRHLGGPQMVGKYVGVVDIQGYLHLIDPAEGTIVGRLQTDGSAATSQPIAAGDVMLWQSEAGNVYAVSAP